MPIEFRCTECGKLLRTPDDTAGREAKCPACGAVVEVPSASIEMSPFGVSPTAPADSTNPYQAPAEYASPGFGAAQPTGVIRPTRIELGDVFSRTWAVFKDQWGMCLVVLVVCWVMSFIAGQAGQWGGVAIGLAADNEVLGMVISQVGGIAAQLFGLWLGIGQAIYFIKTVRGQEASFGDVFAGGPYFLRVLGASILLGLGAMLIVATCLLPCLGIVAALGGAADLGLMAGIIVAAIPMAIYILTFSQYYYLIIDHNAGAIESFRLSFQVTRGNRLTILAIGVIAGVVTVLLGLVTCGLGFLAAWPYLALLYPVMYLAVTGQAVGPAYQMPPTPAP